jgi:hypothetical protein
LYFGTEKGEMKDFGPNNWRHSLSLSCSAVDIACNNNSNIIIIIIINILYYKPGWQV